VCTCPSSGVNTQNVWAGCASPAHTLRARDKEGNGFMLKVMMKAVRRSTVGSTCGTGSCATGARASVPCTAYFAY
jgi:hypothetical protein